MKLALFFVLCALTVSSAAKRNIIFFITDDQSPDAGCYGNAVIKMPHLDALAADGTLFTHAFATTASCSASRSVVLSGLHNHLNGQYGHQHHYHKFAAFENVQSLPVLLQRHGYRTARIGKYHVAPEAVYHFEQTIPGNTRNAVQMANQVKGLIEKDSEKPFFLYFATSDPHRGGGVDQTNPLKPDLFGNKPERKSHDGVEEVFYKPEDVIVPAFLPDTPSCRAELVQYYQSCSRIDSGLGRLVEILKAAGKYEDTLIVFTADHGIAMPGGKTTVYEAGLRVPFVVRDPYQEKRGVRNSAMISHVDITPSLLDFAGAYDAATGGPLRKYLDFKAPAQRAPLENRGDKVERFHGRSWMPILPEAEVKGWDEIGASHTFHEIQMYYPMRVVRDRDYKLIWNIAHPLPFPFASDLWIAPTWQAQFKQGPTTKYGQRTVHDYIQRPEFELFDMRKDEAESTNLAGDPAHHETLERYKKKLKAMQKRTKDPWAMKWKYE